MGSGNLDGSSQPHFHVHTRLGPFLLWKRQWHPQEIPGYQDHLLPSLSHSSEGLLPPHQGSELQQKSQDPAGPPERWGRENPPVLSHHKPSQNLRAFPEVSQLPGAPKKREFPQDPGAQGRVTPVPAPSPSVTANS